MELSTLLITWKTKALLIAMSVLMTLLVSSVVLTYYTNEAYKTSQAEVTKLGMINSSLNSVIAAQQEEIRNRPKQIIETVRDVENELCKGKTGIEAIMNMPGVISLPLTNVVTKQSGGKANEKVYVDIDAEFHPDIVRLLNEEGE